MDVKLVLSTPAGTDLRPEGVPTTQSAWLELIRGAKHSIDLGQFYVASHPGSRLEPVIEELGRAAARGVRIRMLVSNELADEDPATLGRLRALPGLQLRVWNLEKLTGGIIHAKYWVVDEERLYVGSANFDWRSLEHIHETGAVMRDAAIAGQLHRIFESDWKVAESGRLPKVAKAALIRLKRPRGVELVASPPQLNPPGVMPALERLQALLAGAKRSVKIQLLDYSPVEKQEFWPAIDDALRAAAHRGVQVSLLVSDWNAEAAKLPHLKSLSVLPNLDVRMASIPQRAGEFVPYARVIHSKLMIVDGRTLWVGTSNWGPDYFERSRNVELILHRPELAAQADAIWTKLWTSAYVAKLDPSKTYAPPPRSLPKAPAATKAGEAK
jgi:phosphatidylserine/phosphatidylglycerophosphate/cardiolipin synthase-like enzyme